MVMAPCPAPRPQDHLGIKETADEYNPDHVAPDKLSALGEEPVRYRPTRLIRRQFAEAILVLGLLLQRFRIDTFDYELKIKTTLTIKPDEMRIQVVPRPDGARRPFGWPRHGNRRGTSAPSSRAADRHNTPLLVC